MKFILIIYFIQWVINIKLTWEVFYVLWYQILQIRCVFYIHKIFRFGLATFQLRKSHVSGWDHSQVRVTPRLMVVTPLSCPGADVSWFSLASRGRR